MADEKIVTSIVANSDFSNLIADLQRVTSSLHNLQQEFAGGNRALAGQISATNAMFAETMRKTGQYSTHFVSLTSDVEKFGRSLDGGRLKLGDYFRVYQDHVKTSGGLIRDLAKQQVQLQNAVLQPLGKNAQGLMQYNVHIPRGLDVTKNKTALLKQELQIMNKVIQDGGVQLINWGKNTQWAGRQLTVGLTLPLVAFGKAAADAFKVADQELTRLVKVYGDVAGTSAQELSRVRKEVSATAKELSAAMGVNFAETISLAADIAATGKTGNELLGSLKETTRLAVLGEVDRQEAMKATLAIQTAFKQNTDELSESINFLNAVENQTSTTLNDLVTAIPKAGPVIKSLGGDIQDLALYLTAMREGGINASEGANALKSGLASLINPTKQTVGVMKDFGIDILGMVKANAGDTTALLFDLQRALDQLNPLSKAQAIEQMFGKFQFARISALLNNLGREGSQTLQVLDLIGSSAAELEAVAGRELTAVTESAAGRFKRAVESLKADLAGVGDQFLNIATRLINVLDKILEFGQKLPDPIKKILAFGGAFTAIIGPVIMLTGVLANFFGYIIKGLGHFKALFKGAEGFKLLTPEIMAAQHASSLLGDEFYNDAKAADTLRLAIRKLSEDLVLLQKNANSATSATSGLGQIMTTAAGAPVAVMGGPTLLRQSDPNHPLIGGLGRASAHINPRDPNNPATMFGLTFQPEPLNRVIGRTPQVLMTERLPNVEGLTSVGGRSTGVVAGEHARLMALMATLGLQSKQEIEELKKTIRFGGQVSRDFIDTFDDILPITTQLSNNAAAQSAAIVAELNAGKITVEQAKARIIQLNAQLEAMMGQAVVGYGASRGRTIDLTKTPLIDQPIVDATGKPNVRGMFRQGIFRDVMTAVGRATKTRTYGGPYSIETTSPMVPPGYTVNPSGLIVPTIQRNMGGGVFYNNGDQVPGPAVNADVVPAMLTPGEFVIRRDVAQQDPDGMRALNEGRAIVVPTFNRGGRIPGVQYASTGLAISRAMRAAGTAQTKTRAAVLREFATRNRIPASEQSFYFNPKTGVQEDRAHSFFSLSDLARRGAASIRGFFGIAAVNKYNKFQNRLHRKLGTKDINPLTDVTAQTDILPEIFSKGGAGNWFSKNGFIDDGILDTGRIRAFLDHIDDFAKTKRWNSKEFGPPPLGLLRLHDPTSSVRVSDLRDYVEYLISGNVTRINKNGIILNDAAALVDSRRYSPQDAIKEAERIYARAMADGDDDWSYYAKRMDITESEYPFMIQPKNRGGSILRFNRGGKVPGYFNGGITRKWGRVYGGDELSNADPLHGPLQIGKFVGPKDTRMGRRGQRVLYTKPGQTSLVNAFLTGSLEDRGRYVTQQYMLGDYDVLRIPGAIEAMRAWGRKATGTFYRGINFRKFSPGPKPLPDWLMNDIKAAQASGDFSGLIGKEFIMRRSSWSSNPDIANEFGDFRVVADVKNRRVTPSSEMFPGIKFVPKADQNKPKAKKLAAARSEEESIFGGKFRIVKADKDGIHVETVAGPLAGNRRFGGQVNAGMPYVVGENGPELFTPNQPGNIIPGFNKGGKIPGVQYRFGGGMILKLLAALGIATGGQKVGERVGGAPGTAISTASSFLPFMMMPGMSGMTGQITAGQRLGFSAAMPLSTMKQSVFAQSTPVLGRFATTLGTAATSGNVLTKSLSKLLIGITRLTGVLGIAIAAAAGLYKIWTNYNKTQELSAAQFGLTAESAEKAGLKFTDYNQKIKDAIDSQKLLITQNKLTYQSMASAGTPFRMTIAEYKKLRKEIKETMGTQIEVLNAIGNKDVARVAVQLKEQLMAAGLSAEEASKRIYTLFQLSDKASLTVSAMSTKPFTDIINAQTAAVSAINSFNYARSFENTRDQASALNTALTAINTGITDLYDKAEKAAAKKKEDFDSTAAMYNAERKQLDLINSRVQNQKSVGADVLNNLEKQNPLIRQFANTQDSVVSLWQKMRIAARGYTGDLNELNRRQTQRLYDAQIAISEAVEKTNREGILKEQYDLYENLKKQQKELSDAAKGQSVKEQINARDAIRALDKKIKKINEEAEARKKALREEAQAEDIALRIQQQRLEYEKFVSAGDFTGAAESRLELQRLLNEQQTTIAEQQIEEKRLRDVEPLERQKEALQNAQEKLADKAALAAESLDSINRRLTAQKTKIDAVNQAMTEYIIASDKGGKEVKGAAAKFVDALEKAGVSVDKYRYSTFTGKPELVDPVVIADEFKKKLGDLSLNDVTVSTNTGDIYVNGKKLFAEEGSKNNPKELGRASDAPKGTGFTNKGGLAGDLGAFGTFRDFGLNSISQQIKKWAEKSGVKSGEYFTITQGSKADNTLETFKFRLNKEGNIDLIQRYADGGLIKGPGTGTSDSIPGFINGGMPIRVSNGEFIFSKKAVDNAGGPNAVNAMHQYFRNTPGFKDGGAPHEMAMRNQLPGRKKNWFENYVDNLTKTSEQLPPWARDPLGTNQILRKIAGQSKAGDNPALAAALLPLNFLSSGLGSQVSNAASFGRVFLRQAYAGLLNKLPGKFGLSTKFHGGPSGIPSGGFLKQDLRGWNFPGTYLTDDPISAAQYGAVATKNLGRTGDVGSIYKFGVKPGQKVSVLNLSKKATPELKNSLIDLINNTGEITSESKNLVINAIRNSKTIDEAVIAARSVRFDTNDLFKFSEISQPFTSKVLEISGITSESVDLVKNFRSRSALDRLAGLRRSINDLPGLGGYNTEDDIGQWIITNMSKFVSKEIPTDVSNLIGATNKLQSAVNSTGILNSETVGPRIAQQSLENWKTYIKEIIKNQINPGSVPADELRFWTDYLLPQLVKYNPTDRSFKIFKLLTGSKHPYDLPKSFDTAIATGGYINNNKVYRFAGGGYINPSYMSNMGMPSFKTGVNYLYNDTIAELHEGEAVLPKDINPWNPAATNPIGGNTYYVAPVINAAPGMDENAITDLAVTKVMAAFKQAENKVGSQRNINRRYA